MSAYKKAAAPVIGEVVGRAETRIVRSYNTESLLGAFSSDVIRELAGADVAFMNAGGLRADLPEGEVTIGNVQDAFPFYNTVVVQELTGRQIMKIVEQGLTLLRGMVQVSGLTAEYDLERPVGERLVSLTIGGERVEPDRPYRSATNSFLAEGGDLYNTFTEAEWVEEIDQDIAEAVADFMRKQLRPIPPPKMGRLRPIRSAR